MLTGACLQEKTRKRDILPCWGPVTRLGSLGLLFPKASCLGKGKEHRRKPTTTPAVIRLVHRTSSWSQQELWFSFAAHAEHHCIESSSQPSDWILKIKKYQVPRPECSVCSNSITLEFRCWRCPVWIAWHTTFSPDQRAPCSFTSYHNIAKSSLSLGI